MCVCVCVSCASMSVCVCVYDNRGVMSTDARGCEVKGERDEIAWIRRLLSPLGVMNDPKLSNLFEFHHRSRSQVELPLRREE